MLDYRFALPSDMPNLIDFIDLVFSQVREPHDFEQILPKAYGENVDMSDIHAIAVRDGMVRGCLGSLPVTQKMQDEEIRIGYLGSMAVHRHERGNGVMKVLMEMQIARGKEQGLDMLLLGGQRQRYEYYGFYHGGSDYSYYVSRPTVRHGLRDVEPEYDFEKLEEGSVHVAYALNLYNQQPVTGARTLDNFVAACKSYWSQPWIILKDGTPVGYLVSNANGDHVNELITEAEAMIPVAIKSWWGKRSLSALHVTAAAYNAPLNRALSRFAENYSMGQDCMMKILNPERVIRAYMKLKNSLTPLQDGVMTLKMGEHNTLKIEVKGGEVSVSPTSDAPDATLTMEEAAHFLFGANRFYAPEVKAPAGWLPLTFSVATPDTF